MSVINILSPFVADLIAAGEVVERPGSVVKELMENSIDAGAKNITVELRGGGSALIKVTDDGCGMSPEDAGIAFLRHATSKLSDERGLEAIGTLGFRGEALAAISSVSRIELLTRQKNADSGTRITLEAGEIQQMHEAGCREGSSMAVRDLFYNTPARRKFLKSDRAEGANCVNLALRSALGHPEISVRCVRDGKEEFFTPGDGKASSCIYSLLGRELAGSLLECSLESDGVAVSGYISAPHSGRGNRASQFFFVNGRPIRSQTLQAAVEQAYKNTLLTGRFPACVIYINVSFGSVDVNVHPTKNEVKFSEEKKIFDAVYYAALGALSRETGTAEISLSPRTEKAISAPPAPEKKPPAPEARASVRPVQTEIKEVKTPITRPISARPAPREDFWGSMTSAQFRAEKAAPARSEVRSYSMPIEPLAPKKEPPAPAPAEPPVRDETSPIAEAAPIEEPIRIIGEALDTYIIVEKGDALILIDKHAAHERIIFDRLRASTGAVMSQALLAPITWHCGGENLDLLEKNSALLEKVGFEVEPYGEDCAAIRAVPADMEGTEVSALEEICEKLALGGAPDSMRDEILHTVACKAAIKAGSRSDPMELRELAERVVSGEVKYCPHGRPIAVTLTKKELDKQFKRIV